MNSPTEAVLEGLRTHGMEALHNPWWRRQLERYYYGSVEHWIATGRTTSPRRGPRGQQVKAVVRSQSQRKRGIVTDVNNLV